MMRSKKIQKRPQRTNKATPRPRDNGTRNRTGASQGMAGMGLNGYLARHLQVLLHSLGRLSRTPFSTLMTAAVIGIALALPTGLHVTLKSTEQLTANWEGATQISLFLKQGLSEKEERDFASRLRSLSEIADVHYISAQQALDEFRQFSGFGEVLDHLDKNPLPALLVVQPALNSNTPEGAQRLVSDLKTYPEVDIAQLDMQWVKRLYALLEITQRGIAILAFLLALAVLLIVGNTIRLAIENRRDEIVITKLIGATDAFIRRPFLYTGFWYGIFGSLIALLLVNTSLGLLRPAVRQLAGLYNSPFQLGFLDVGGTMMLFIGGISLGLLGALLAVSRHLRAIEPR